MNKYYEFKVVEYGGAKWMVCPECYSEINMEVFNSADSEWRKQFLEWHYQVDCKMIKETL